MPITDAKNIKWFAEPLTKNVRLALADGCFPTGSPDKWKAFLEDTNATGRLLAQLEYPTLDIELEMWRADGEDYDLANNEMNGITLSYVICCKYGEGKDDWETHGSTGADNIEPYVDFLSDDWEKQLKDDMQRALEEYAEFHGLSLTEINAL